MAENWYRLSSRGRSKSFRRTTSEAVNSRSDGPQVPVRAGRPFIPATALQDWDLWRECHLVWHGFRGSSVQWGRQSQPGVEMARIVRVLVLALALVVLGSACSGADTESQPAGVAPSNPDCAPGDVVGEPISQPDRRIEDIIEVLTGERQTGDDDPVEETITDPNFGGVWGDSAGGVVVAVLDCSRVDADELARIAGGVGYLHLIEVPYTYRQVDEFKRTLIDQLRAAGIGSDVSDISIESTRSGRMIEVRVRDTGLLPDSFGSGVPEDAYEIIESETAGTTPAG